MMSFYKQQLNSRRIFGERLQRGRNIDEVPSYAEWFNENFAKPRILANQMIEQEDITQLNISLDKSLAMAVEFFENSREIHTRKLDPLLTEKLYMNMFSTTVCLIQGQKKLYGQMAKEVSTSSAQLNPDRELFIDNFIKTIKDIARLDAILETRTNRVDKQFPQLLILSPEQHDRLQNGFNPDPL